MVFVAAIDAGRMKPAAATARVASKWRQTLGGAAASAWVAGALEGGGPLADGSGGSSSGDGVGVGGGSGDGGSGSNVGSLDAFLLVDAKRNMPHAGGFSDDFLV